MSDGNQSQRVIYLFKAFNGTLNHVLDRIFSSDFINTEFGAVKDPRELAKLKEKLRNEAIVRTCCYDTKTTYYRRNAP
jgi:hypothetical protein